MFAQSSESDQSSQPRLKPMSDGENPIGYGTVGLTNVNYYDKPPPSVLVKRNRKKERKLQKYGRFVSSDGDFFCSRLRTSLPHEQMPCQEINMVKCLWLGFSVK